MGDTTPATLNHFSLIRFKGGFWDLDAPDRNRTGNELVEALRSNATATHVYQVFPTEPHADLLIWSAGEAVDKDSGTRFFRSLQRSLNPHRKWVEFPDILWGLTKPSQYTKVRSTQEIDPFDARRSPYLIVYPFVKTVDWYLLPREDRQTMMNEHIQVGKQYRDITQLLLYSFGLQDQEFVVVYETDDLVRFSNLVHELRATKGRKYTERDSPLHAACFIEESELKDFWS